MKATRSFWTTGLWTELIFVPAGVLAQGIHVDDALLPNALFDHADDFRWWAGS